MATEQGAQGAQGAQSAGGAESAEGAKASEHAGPAVKGSEYVGPDGEASEYAGSGAEGDEYAGLGADAVDGYLRRIGAERSAGTDAEALGRLQLQHLRSVPFENLSIHLGEEIVLTQQALLDKLVRDRRGGFCYELNGAFAMLLTALGYDAELLSGRVYGEGGRLGIPYDHAAVRVRTAGGPLLADVGFGRHSHYPLRLDTAEEQTDPGGVFRVVARDDGDLDVLRDGAPQYRLEPRPRALADFEAGCWWQTTSPKSHFTQSLVCSRLTDDGGRITLSGRTLVITAPDGSRTEREVPEAELLAAYRTHFAIPLERAPLSPSPPVPVPVTPAAALVERHRSEEA